jgi:hypothetical protein
MSTKSSDSGLNAMGHIGDKLHLMSIDTGASVTITRPDISAGLPEKEIVWLYIMQMLSGETLPILKQVLMELSLGQHP